MDGVRREEDDEGRNFLSRGRPPRKKDVVGEMALLCWLFLCCALFVSIVVVLRCLPVLGAHKEKCLTYNVPTHCIVCLLACLLACCLLDRLRLRRRAFGFVRMYMYLARWYVQPYELRAAGCRCWGLHVSPGRMYVLLE
jgi:hypothetical protein